MKVIYKAPGCAPEPRDIPNTLEELQATVGGYTCDAEGQTEL